MIYKALDYLTTCKHRAVYVSLYSRYYFLGFHNVGAPGTTWLPSLCFVGSGAFIRCVSVDSKRARLPASFLAQRQPSADLVRMKIDGGLLEWRNHKLDVCERLDH
jgi:hypothetical protein